MNKKSPKHKSGSLPLLNEGANVTAVIIAIEDYQHDAAAPIPSVDHAKADAEAFLDVLQIMYPDNDIHSKVLINEQATSMSVKNAIRYEISATGPDDLFIFYYAGHGFHNGVSNMITVWDSKAQDWTGTCLDLRKLLLDPLKKSPCTKLLTFIDACSVSLEDQTQSRDVISSMSESEFKKFVKIDAYVGLFLSCTPGQKSYSNSSLGHGVWSYHLLEALNGNAPKAIDAYGVITDVSLRDYLAKTVPQFVTKHMNVSGKQIPMAETSSANRFGICVAPVKEEPAHPQDDFTPLNISFERSYFAHVETKSFDRLPGFRKGGGHFVPEQVNDASAAFARSLLEKDFSAEIKGYYSETKSEFGLKRRDLPTGDGTLDSPHFRYWIDVRQTPEDPSEVEIIRCLMVRDSESEILQSIDEIFGSRFDRFVCQIEGHGPNFDDLVDFLEDAEEAHGGSLDEDEGLERAIYQSPEGVRIEFDLGDSKVSICAPNRGSFHEILSAVGSVALGSTGHRVKYLVDDLDHEDF